MKGMKGEKGKTKKMRKTNGKKPMKGKKSCGAGGGFRKP